MLLFNNKIWMDLLNKYPKLRKNVKLYKNTSLFFIILEGFICYMFLNFIILINFFLAEIIKLK